MEPLIILAIGIVALTILQFSGRIEPPVYFMSVGASIVIAGLFWLMTMFNFGAMDREIWNGEVSNKRNQVEMCPRGWVSYTDNFCSEYKTRQVHTGRTCTGSGKEQVCTDNYDTEYKYIYPWEGRWFIFAANIKARWEIERVDRQGAVQPKQYAAINVGDPASTTNVYTNWVRAAADSIFHEDGQYAEKYKDAIPEYPGKIYDVLKVRRIVPVGVTIPDIDQFNDKLAVALKSLGPQRQMNAIIVVVDATKYGPDYQYAIRRAWKGFKKNDAVTFIGIDKEDHIMWASSLSWSKSSMYDIEIREKILGDRTDRRLDLNAVIDNIQTIGMQHYERRSMKEFEFLKSEIRTPVWLTTIFGSLQAMIIFVIFFISRKETYRHVYR